MKGLFSGIAIDVDLKLNSQQFLLMAEGTMIEMAFYKIVSESIFFCLDEDCDAKLELRG